MMKLLVVPLALTDNKVFRNSSFRFGTLHCKRVSYPEKKRIETKYNEDFSLLYFY